MIIQSSFIILSQTLRDLQEHKTMLFFTLIFFEKHSYFKKNKLAAAGACPSAIYRGLNEEEEQVQGLAGLTRAQREKNPCSPSRF